AYGDETQLVNGICAVDLDVFVVPFRFLSGLIVIIVALSVPVEFVIYLKTAANTILVKQVKVHSQLARLSLRERSLRVLLKELGAIVSFLNQHTPKLLNLMSVSGITQEQTIRAVGRLVGGEQIIEYRPYVAVAFTLPQYLFIDKIPAVVETKIPSRVNVPGERYVRD